MVLYQLSYDPIQSRKSYEWQSGLSKSLQGCFGMQLAKNCPVMMSNEKILLVGRRDSAKLDQPLRDLGCTVSRVDTFAAAEGLQGFKLVIADANALKECEEDGSWPVEKRDKLALVVSLSGNDEIPEWARRHIAGCLTQEVSRGQLSILLQAVAAQRRQQAFVSRWPQTTDDGELVGGSPAVEQLRETIRNLSRTQATVLIRGEAGTDKAGVAVALHRQSPRADEILWQIDCAVAEAAEAELFEQTEGTLHLADGGTLVLNEVGRLPGTSQEKLMRYLADRGGRSDPRHARDNVRFIVTTSDDLEAECKTGAFREDLFLCLNMGPVSIGPLRDRKSDLRELAEHIRRRIASQYGSEAVAFSPSAFEALEGYGWPGNMAELRHVIGRAVILASEERVIEPVHLRLGVDTLSPVAGQEQIATLRLEDVQRQHIFRVLERCQWNRTHAAAKLGISIRTLRNKLREYRTASAEATPEERAA